MERVTYRDFREFAADRHVDAQSSTRVRLAPSLLLTHEMGTNGDVSEYLTADIQARVEFDIASADIRSAELLFYVNADDSTKDRPMRIQVNGQQINHRQKRQRMLTGGWDRCRIPARYLQTGRNTLVFSAHGTLHVDPAPGGLADPPTTHSSRSFDGGKTWHQGAHGPNADLHGEYLVRLRLKGYAPEGVLTAPVIDLADVRGAGRIAPQAGIRRVQLEAREQCPKGTAIAFELRTGSTPDVDPRTWTPWQHGASLKQPRRFLQWRGRLSTTSAAVSPLLRSVTLEVEARHDHQMAAIDLIELDQPELVHSSYAFTHMAPNHRQARLRSQYRLDEVIAPGKTELEQLALLRDWVHSQWLGWQSGAYPYCPPWDPLEILEVTKGNCGFGMCTHYGATFASCAAALGFVSRSLVVDHHCLAEVWSEDLQKWILQDAGPSREYDATYEHEGTPLNALELHELFARGEQKSILANKLPQGITEVMADHVTTFVRFGIPLRNDHLVHAEPAELRHGSGQYHWDGYLWWSDGAHPTYAEYSLQTRRPEDLYWSVNQTRIYLQHTGAPEVLGVLLEHTMPNFAHFLVRQDGGAWEAHEDAHLAWELGPGAHTLEVRAVNHFGRMGRVSRVRVALDS
jgi:hypothetical protein